MLNRIGKSVERYFDRSLSYPQKFNDEDKNYDCKQEDIRKKKSMALDYANRHFNIKKNKYFDLLDH